MDHEKLYPKTADGSVMDDEEPERVLRAPTVYKPPEPKKVSPPAYSRAGAPNANLCVCAPQEPILDSIDAPPWEGPSLQAPKPKAVVEVCVCVCVCKRIRGWALSNLQAPKPTAVLLCVYMAT